MVAFPFLCLPPGCMAIGPVLGAPPTQQGRLPLRTQVDAFRADVFEELMKHTFPRIDLEHFFQFLPHLVSEADGSSCAFRAVRIGQIHPRYFRDRALSSQDRFLLGFARSHGRRLALLHFPAGLRLVDGVSTCWIRHFAPSFPRFVSGTLPFASRPHLPLSSPPRAVVAILASSCNLSPCAGRPTSLVVSALVHLPDPNRSESPFLLSRS